MRLTAIALAAAVALVGCTGAPTEPEPETASAAQFVACLKAAGVEARVGTQGHALVLVGGPPTGEPGEVVRHESSAEGEAQGWSYGEVDESGSWDAAETAAYFADDPDTQDAYAACEKKHPDFTQPQFDPTKDPEFTEMQGEQQEAALAFAQCARKNGYPEIADPGPGSMGGSIMIPAGFTEDDFRALIEACYDPTTGFGFGSNEDLGFEPWTILEEFQNAPAS